MGYAHRYIHRTSPGAVQELLPRSRHILRLDKVEYRVVLPRVMYALPGDMDQLASSVELCCLEAVAVGGLTLNLRVRRLRSAALE
jgi:hypothetical protein